MLPTASTIRSIVRENPSVVTLELEGDIGATPGQFLMLWLPGVDEKPFSLMSDSPLSVTIARVGPFTERVHDLEIGVTIGRFRGFMIYGQRIEAQCFKLLRIQFHFS